MVKNLKNERLNSIIEFDNGEKIKIIDYKTSTDVVVEFQDENKGKVHTCWGNIKKQLVSNPYKPTVHGVGIVGNIKTTGKYRKEYSTWKHMIERCFDSNKKNKNPSYINVTCCEEWIVFENFYNWIIKEENYEKWKQGDSSKWALDKDILFKHNKIYSPSTCCLVPKNVNTLFVKNDAKRGDLPIGVTYNHKRFMTSYSNPFTGNANEYLGTYDTPLEAHYAYKEAKEKLIKMVAQDEYDKGNITKMCYKSMMNYQVEITD